MTKAANNSVPDYTSTNTGVSKTKSNDDYSVRCIADSDASTLWDSSNESISHESNDEHSAASTLCDSSLESNEDRSAASTIDYDNTAHPFDTLAKLCYIMYEIVSKAKPTKREPYNPKEHFIRVSFSTTQLDWARFEHNTDNLDQIQTIKKTIKQTTDTNQHQSGKPPNQRQSDPKQGNNRSNANTIRNKTGPDQRIQK
jgi:hypothetical protein